MPRKLFKKLLSETKNYSDNDLQLLLWITAATTPIAAITAIFIYQLQQNNDQKILIALSIAGLAVSLTATWAAFALKLMRTKSSLLNDLMAEKKQLARERTDLELVLDEKINFISNLSHEVRSPLHLILGNAELLHESSLNQEQLDHLEKIQKSGSELLQTFDHILQIAKKEFPSAELNIRQLDFLNFIEEAITQIRNLKPYESPTFQFIIDPDIPKNLTLDPIPVRNLILEICSKLRSYPSLWPAKILISIEKPVTTQSEIIICIDHPKLAKGNFECAAFVYEMRELVAATKGKMSSLKSDDHEYAITILIPAKNESPFSWADDFIGAANSPKRVKLFFQSEPYEAFVKTILKSKNIMLESQKIENIFSLPAKDTSILFISEPGAIEKDIASRANIIELAKFILPSELLQIIGYKRRPQFKQEYARDRKKTNKKTILLVEDDEANLTLLRSYFKSTNYKLLIARNGAEALEEYQSSTPDLIITDLRMPILDGVGLIRKIREHEKARSAISHKIIVLTADALHDSESLSKDLKISRYLTKPLRKGPFLESVNELLASGV